MPKSSFILLIISSFLLFGCGSADKKSSSAENATQYNKKLKVDESPKIKKYVNRQKAPSSLALPPDLLESANDTVAGNYASSQNQADRQQVLPEVVGAKIVAEGERRWLEVEAPAEEVWKRITSYWAEEQVALVNYNPEAGIMETDWIEDTIVFGDGSSKALNFTRELFNRVTGQGVAHDKYTIRLERAANAATRVYVSHRATIKKEQDGISPVKIANFDWVQVEDNPEKIAEMLQLMVLLFDTSGLDTA